MEEDSVAINSHLSLRGDVLESHDSLIALRSNGNTTYNVGSVLWRFLSTLKVFSTSGDNISTVGDSFRTVGDSFSTVGNSFSTVGDSFSTVKVAQYSGEIASFL